MRNKYFTAGILITIGIMLWLLIPFGCWWLHGDYDRYIWIINGPFPFSHLGSGPLQMGLTVLAALGGLVLIIAAVLFLVIKRPVQLVFGEAKRETYTGTIIEESLADKSILKKMRIISTKVEPVTEKHKTPWLTQWTLHKVEISAGEASEIAELLSHAIDTAHSAWYADFKTDTHHFIIFPNKVFSIERSKKEHYDEATRYGISLGIPSYQVDFSPHVKVWKR
jgi:hypothetical protein